MKTDLTTLNEQQRAAILNSVDKNVVLLAGAGSGKTFTIVKRTEYLINDLNVDPSSIMLVTFTNKAANEIVERVSKVCPDASKMWIGTFHRICVKILRIAGHKLGIKYFSILDTKAQKEVIKEILDSKGLESGPYVVNSVIKKISEFKNNMRRPTEVLTDPKVQRVYADIYQEYQNKCWRQRTFDFDDLILYSILLLEKSEEVTNWAHNKFKYIICDECQDVNSSQFILLNRIMGNNNVMLVGDISQSIYGFRNAKPKYLNEFASIHPNTITLKLEQNYRSTKNIIYAANKVVEHNSFGTKVEMFCNNESGEKIQIHSTNDNYLEAKWVVSEISCYANKSYSDFAIIYRANYQSHLIEEELIKAGIPYTIFGSLSFYSRKEVTDMLCWLKLYTNPHDITSFKRILTNIKGIGNSSINKMVDYANANHVLFKDSMLKIKNNFKESIKAELKAIQEVLNTPVTKCSKLVELVYSKTNIRKSLVTLGTEDANDRITILDEFQDMVHSMETKDNISSMNEIIDQISLLKELKGNQKAEANCVKLMTAHASKGLEFDTVFILEAQEGSFPHKNAIASCSKDAIEEERRLFYVAMTRAKKKLYITYVTRVKNNETNSIMSVNRSRFLNEIPVELTEECF